MAKPGLLSDAWELISFFKALLKPQSGKTTEMPIPDSADQELKCRNIMNTSVMEKYLWKIGLVKHAWSHHLRL